MHKNRVHITKVIAGFFYGNSYKWRPSWIFEFFRNFFLPMSLSSSIRSIYRKPHQNRISSSRVKEGQTNIQTNKHTYILYPFINSRDIYMCVCVSVCLSFYNLRTTESILMRFSINGPYGWRKWHGQNKNLKKFKNSKWPPFFMKK